MIKAPSEIHPSLTDERIDTIGHLIARVRMDNLDSADDRDNGWSLGCRAYAWCMNEITNLALSQPWLKVIDPSLKFIFAIGSIEVSFYKGDTDNPKKKIMSRAQAYPELRQMSLLQNTDIPEKLVWAYVVETDAEGLTTNIEFLGMSEAGDIIASRRIPLHNRAFKLVEIAANESKPAELNPAPVSLPKLKVVKAKKDDTEN